METNPVTIKEFLLHNLILQPNFGLGVYLESPSKEQQVNVAQSQRVGKMSVIPPEQLVPVLAPNVSLESLETRVSGEQIQLLIRLDESSSVSLLASLLSLSLADCVKELKTLTARGLTLLQHRKPHTTTVQQSYTWEESLEVLEALQRSLEGSSENLSSTLTDIFVTPSAQLPAVQGSEWPIPSTPSAPTSHPGIEIEPTLTELPTLNTKKLGETATETPSLFGHRYAPDSDEQHIASAHHTLDSAAELPAMTPELIAQYQQQDAGTTQPEILPVNKGVVASYDSFDHSRNQASTLSVPKRAHSPSTPMPKQVAPEKEIPIDSATSWDQFDKAETQKSCESTDPNLPPLPPDYNSKSQKT